MSITETTPSSAELALPAGTWSIDPVHSSVGFAICHLGLTTVRGHFRDFEGTIDVAAAGAVAIEGTVRAASIDTRAANRDAQLRSADVLDAEHHPDIGFRATAVERVEDGTYEITGELTLHGVTRGLTLAAVVTGTEQDPWGNTRLGLQARGEIDREAHGVAFNLELAGGGWLIGRRLQVTLDISAVKRSEAIDPRPEESRR